VFLFIAIAGNLYISYPPILNMEHNHEETVKSSFHFSAIRRGHWMPSAVRINGIATLTLIAALDTLISESAADAVITGVGEFKIRGTIMKTRWTIIMLSVICLILSSTVSANSLTDAIAKGDIDAVRSALKKGANVNSKEGEAPALIVALQLDHPDIARLLIEKGAKIGAKEDYMGSTALHEAAYRQYLDVVRLLVEKGAKVNAKNNIGFTPFRYAAMDYFSKEDAGDIILFLIAKGANVNEKDKKGETALHGLALNGKTNLLRILLDNGAKVNTATNEGITPLHLAAGNGNAECVQLLIDRGADVNIKAKDGKTAMDFAIKNGQEETAEFLRKVIENR
jgi:ankyrin repeat protein